MKGITTRDIEHYNPRCNARGTIKAGTVVYWASRVSLWVVSHSNDVPFMDVIDFAHSYVDVPADAVQITETP